MWYGLETVACHQFAQKFAIADFFTSINNYGAEMFDLGWIQAAVRLFVLFGWALFITGTAVAVFDVAIEYQRVERGHPIGRDAVQAGIGHGTVADVDVLDGRIV